MKLNTTDFARKLQHPLLMGLGSVPLAIIIGLNFTPESWQLVLCFPAAYVLLSWICLLTPGKKRIAAGLAGAVLLIALLFSILHPAGRIGLVLLPVMYILLLILTLPIGGWTRHQELNVGWHVGGVMTHVVLQLLLSGSRLTGNGVYDPAQMPLIVNFLCFMVLVLLAMNRTSLETASQGRRQVPLLMRRQNLVITFVLLAAGVALAALPAVGRMLAAAWEGLIRVIAWLVELFMKLYPQGSGGSGGGGMGDMGMGLGEATEPSALALLLEKIIGTVTVIAIVIGAVLLLRLGWKKLRKLVQFLWRCLSRYGMAAGEDYEDEITSTRDEEGAERENVFSRLRRMRAPDEKNLTPGQRVRSRYRHLKQRRRWSGAATARETLPERAAALYERARYSGMEMTDQEAEAFREETKRL